MKARKRAKSSVLPVTLATNFFLIFSLPAVAQRVGDYEIRGAQIWHDGQPVVLRGVNAMHIFGGDDPSLLSWKGIGIVREFVGDLKDTPLGRGEQYCDSKTRRTLHSLQDIVDANRANGMVTILCPFSWDGTKETQFAGVGTPTQARWYQQYKQRMREWAQHFRGQSDVWIEVMNEPFTKLGGAQDDQYWLQTVADMVSNLRRAGWGGIILVPGSDWGGGEAIVERMGPRLLAGRRNILFDIHIYNNWLAHPDKIPERCARVKESGLPFIFAELGPGNKDQYLVDPRPFIHAARRNNFSVLAWGWGTWGERHYINLQTNDGGPNDNGNFNWGSAFKNFLAAGAK